MARFVRVKELPTEVDKECYTISEPNFAAEIKACSKKKPKSKAMTTHYLREIIGTIGLKYADETFDALTQVNVSRYRGVPFETEADVHDILNTVINKQCPRLNEDYLNFQIKNRPEGTKLIYFSGGFDQTAVFTKNGIDEIKEKEIDVFLGKKQKKIIGKPAISNEEAKAAKSNK